MFGGQECATDSFVKFQPALGMDTVYQNGTSFTISVKFHCISLMKEYEDKSFEELRLEDYGNGRGLLVCRTCIRPYRKQDFLTSANFYFDLPKTINWPQATNWPSQTPNWPTQTPKWPTQAPKWPMPMQKPFRKAGGTRPHYVRNIVSENTKTFEKTLALFNGKMKSSLTCLLEQFYLDLSDDVEKVVRLEVQSEIDKLRSDLLSVLDLEIRKFKYDFNKIPNYYEAIITPNAGTIPNETFDMATIKGEINSLIESEMNKFKEEINSTLSNQIKSPTQTIKPKSNMSTSNMKINDSCLEESSHSKNFNYNAIDCTIKGDLPTEINTESEEIEKFTPTDQSQDTQSSQSEVKLADKNASEFKLEPSKMNSQIEDANHEATEEKSLNLVNLRPEVKSVEEKVENATEVKFLSENTSVKEMLQSEDVDNHINTKSLNSEENQPEVNYDAQNAKGETEVESLKKNTSARISPQSENTENTFNTKSVNLENIKSETKSDSKKLEDNSSFTEIQKKDSCALGATPSEGGETNVFGSVSTPSTLKTGQAGSTGLFGQPQTTHEGGEGSSSITGRTDLFGSTSARSTGLFGQPLTTNTGSVGLSSTIATGGTGVLESTSTRSTGLFSQPQTTNAGGGSLPCTTGGTSVFGSSTTCSTGLFGQPLTTKAGARGLSATTEGTSGFGSTSNRSTGLFGQPQTTNASGGGLPCTTGGTGGFGSTSTRSTGLFGQPQTTNATGGGLSCTTGGMGGFGSTSTRSTGLFGQPQIINDGAGALFSTTGGTGGFGSTSTCSTGLFGQPQLVNAGAGGLSSPTEGTGGFGSTSNRSTGLFGQPQTTNASGGGLPCTTGGMGGFGSTSTRSTGLFGQPQLVNAGAGGLFSPTEGTGGFGSTSNRSTGLFGQPQTTNASGGGLPCTTGGMGGFGSTSTRSTGLFGQPQLVNAGAGGLFSPTGYGKPSPKSPSTKKSAKKFNFSFFPNIPAVSINLATTTSSAIFGFVKTPTIPITFGSSPSVLTANSASSSQKSSTTTSLSFATSKAMTIPILSSTTATISNQSKTITFGAENVISNTKEATSFGSISTLEQMGKLLDEKRLDLDEVKKTVILELNSKTEKLDDIRSDIENLKDKITSIFKFRDTEFEISKINHDTEVHEFTPTALVVNYANTKQTLLNVESHIVNLKREPFDNNHFEANSERELQEKGFISLVKSILEHEIENIVITLHFTVVSLKFQTERLKKELIDILVLTTLESENKITHENIFEVFVYLTQVENDFRNALKSVISKFEILEKVCYCAVEKKKIADSAMEEQLEHIFNVIIESLRPKLEDLEVEFLQIVEPLKIEVENIRNQFFTAIASLNAGECQNCETKDEIIKLRDNFSSKIQSIESDLSDFAKKFGPCLRLSYKAIKDLEVKKDVVSEMSLDKN